MNKLILLRAMIILLFPTHRRADVSAGGESTKVAESRQMSDCGGGAVVVMEVLS